MKKVKDYHAYAKVSINGKVDYKVLGIYFTCSLEQIEHHKEHCDKEVMNFCKENYIEILSKIEYVSCKKSKWVHGEYFAHEYPEGENRFQGRGRKLTYSNGLVEYEIQCLDKTKEVIDGIVGIEYLGNGVIGNGYGDYFEPFSEIK